MYPFFWVCTNAFLQADENDGLSTDFYQTLLISLLVSPAINVFLLRQLQFLLSSLCRVALSWKPANSPQPLHPIPNTASIPLFAFLLLSFFSCPTLA